MTQTLDIGGSAVTIGGSLITFPGASAGELDVAGQTGFVSLSQPGETVAGQTGFVSIRSPGFTVANQTAFIVLDPHVAQTRRRQYYVM